MELSSHLSATSLPSDPNFIATEEEVLSSELFLPAPTSQQGSLERLFPVSEHDSDSSSLHAALSAPSLDDGGQRERAAEIVQPSRRVSSANPSGRKGRRSNVVQPLLNIEKTAAWNEPEGRTSVPPDSKPAGHGKRTPVFGISRTRIAPAPEGFETEARNQKRVDSPIVWDSNGSLSSSQVSLSKTSRKGMPLLGSHKARVAPSPDLKEPAFRDGIGARRTPDISVFVSEGNQHSLESIRTIEEATGEKIVEPQDSPRLEWLSASHDQEERAPGEELAMPSLPEIEHEPYIPLAFAQEALARVASDMQKMKDGHVQVVGKIEGAYRYIEEDSQSQYREFVNHLRQQHTSKVALYKQVVQLLHNELDRMKEYWEGTSQSLVKRNQELLEENRNLYRHMKDGAAQMAAEKEHTTKKLTMRMEKERQKRVAELKKARGEMQDLEARYSSQIKLLQETAAVEMEKERASHQCTMKELERALLESEAKQIKLVEEANVGTQALTPAQAQLIKESHGRSTHELKKMMSLEAAETPLRTSVRTAQRELKAVQDQMQSLLIMFSSEPGLQDALGSTVGQLTDEVTALRSEKRDLEEQLEEMSGSGSQHLEEGIEMDASIEQLQSRLVDLSTALSSSEEKLDILQALQLGQIPLIAERRPMSPTDTLTESAAAQTSTPQLSDAELEPELDDASDVASEADSDVVGHDAVEGGETLTEDHEEAPIEDETLEEPPPAVCDDQPGADVRLQEKPRDLKSGEEEEIHTTAAVAGQKSSLKDRPSQKQMGQQDLKRLREQIIELKKQQQTDIARIKTLEKELRSSSKAAGGSVEEKKELKKREKEMKDLRRQQEISRRNLEKAQGQLKTTDAELAALKKEHERMLEDAKKSSQELQGLADAAKESMRAAARVKELEQEVKQQASQLKSLTDNYNSERILRKKYYNVIEDMKGKIRVYCRARPLSKTELARSNFSVLESQDEFSVTVKTQRGVKDFQFDQVFMEQHSQERVFEDTNNLIQSAVDGYNVCIFAYGQTGSGKTYTMIGGKDATNTITAPGIAPRAFETIFKLMKANRSKFSFAISVYMLELYNDRLMDLFQKDHRNPPKLDIKKDKKGLVYVPGSVTHPAASAAELMELFEKGSKSRHVASTKMNAESSRSHLVIGIVIESTNLTNGAVHRGKLSLVDLAGSERASKTEASAEQLKEAQSINKSLSALGDVISALSSGQDFIPYRNNKLTLLMQDSLGGNAKTLMFVNISPADYNTEETVVSLTYAARVKLITNDASKNADNKEITRLKGVIAKLRKGETVGEEEL